MLNLRKLLSIHQVLLPSMCHLCHLPSNNSFPLCAQCISILPWNNTFCIKCAAKLPDELGNNICGHCISHVWSFNYCFAAFSYGSYIRKMVAQLKFHKQLINAHLLGQLLCQQIPHWYEGNALPQVLIPVPLHPSRTRKRGFNQALEICKTISKLIHIPIDYKICRRIKKTKPQTTLHKDERKSNLVGAFSIGGRPLPFETPLCDSSGRTGACIYTHVAIVDDVFTTGDTVEALAKILKQAGVKQVDVWCVARAKLVK